MTGASGKQRHAPCGVDDTPKQKSTENLSSLAGADLSWPRSVHRGRCHEASCKWDRMRRPRAGDERNPPSSRAAPGHAQTSLRSLRKCKLHCRGHYDPPARSWLTAGHQACPRLERRGHPKGIAASEPEARRNGASESAARRRNDVAMERRTARASRQTRPRRKAWIEQGCATASRVYPTCALNMLDLG